MAFSVDQEARISELAHKAVDGKLRSHAEACPWRYEVKLSILRLILLLIGSGTVSGTIVTAALKCFGGNS